MATTRRTALKAAAAGAVTVFYGTVPGAGAFAAGGLRARRCVNDMKLDDPDLETYRAFVGLMQQKPQNQPLSWIGFANQHGNAQDYKYCPHGDWYFLPWHREFMIMYEKAASVLMQNPSFAMPYWDWTKLRDYPPAFSQPTYKGKPNPLYLKERRALKGPWALTDAITGPKVIAAIYRETVYEAFGTSRNPQQKNLDPKWVPEGGGYQGILERTPHNNVHNFIGGFMPNSNSPRDPIFMMHHGNIDRIWAYWNALGRKNSTDPLWMGMKFADNYLTPQGTPYSSGVSDLLDTKALGYTYDNMPAGLQAQATDTRRAANMASLFDPSATAKPLRVKKPNSTAATPGKVLSVPFKVQDTRLQSTENAEPRDIVALISDIEVADSVSAIRIFVNHPSPTLDVPETDPHFVGTVAFLRHPKAGPGHEGHKSLPSTIVSLTEALKNISGDKPIAADDITVQLLPVPQPGAAQSTAATVKPAAIEIAVL